MGLWLLRWTVNILGFRLLTFHFFPLTKGTLTTGTGNYRLARPLFLRILTELTIHVLHQAHALIKGERALDIYLLLTEFEGRTVSCGPRFFRFMAQARSARAIHRMGKKRGSVTYSTDRENEVSKIFIISLVCVWGAQEHSYSRGTASNFWRTSKAKRVSLKSFLSR